MEYVSSLGTCKKCGRDKIQTGDSIKCIFCDYDLKVPTGPTNDAPDIGEKELNKILSGLGVKLPTVKDENDKVASTVAAPKAQMIPVKSIPQDIVDECTFAQKIGQAMDILKSLPMPKDIKQFKVVNRVIKSLESLVTEIN